MKATVGVAQRMGLVMAWLSLVVLGLSAIAFSKSAPGERAGPPAHWPTESSLSHSSTRNTVVMFLHAGCPCSRASLTEVGAALSESNAGEHTDVVFVFFELADAGIEPSQTQLWQSALRIPNATAVVDVGDRERARFDARTSGTTLVYGPGGGLRFSGGVTGSRGHAGDNAGRQGVAEALRGSTTQREEHAVFGCDLREPSNDTTTGEPSP